MGAQNTLLCIHRDPGELLHLEQSGYRLVTATCGHEGLGLLMSQAVDAVVIEYHLGLLDGGVVASEIKHARPEVPIVMVCDNLDLPDDALKAVDAVVVRSDGQHFLMATLHFVLSMEAEQRRKGARRGTARPFNRLRSAATHKTALAPRPAEIDERDAPLPVAVWMSILRGDIQF